MQMGSCQVISISTLPKFITDEMSKPEIVIFDSLKISFPHTFPFSTRILFAMVYVVFCHQFFFLRMYFTFQKDVLVETFIEIWWGLFLFFIFLLFCFVFEKKGLIEISKLL